MVKFLSDNGIISFSNYRLFSGLLLFMISVSATVLPAFRSASSIF